MSKLTEHIKQECSPVDTDRLYDEVLDSDGDVTIGCLTFSPSRIIKELDPIAYRCGKNDYIDCLDLDEVDGSEYESRDVDKACESLVDEIESEISDLETELEEAEAEVTSAESENIDGFGGNQLDAWLVGLNMAKEGADKIRTKLDEKRAELEETKQEIKSL